MQWLTKEKQAVICININDSINNTHDWVDSITKKKRIQAPNKKAVTVIKQLTSSHKEYRNTQISIKLTNDFIFFKQFPL